VLSLVIAAHNGAAWLARQLTSIAEQDFSAWETIVVDDGSTDHTATIAAEFEARDSRFRLIRIPPGGAANARNTGLDSARGEWVSFPDCDDEIPPGTLSRAARWSESPSVDLIIFSLAHHHEGNASPQEKFHRLPDRTFASAADLLRHGVRGGTTLLYSAANKFYRTRQLQKHRITFPVGVSFGEDRRFNFDYLRHCGAVRTEAHVGYLYLTRPGNSQSQRYRADMGKLTIALHQAKADLMRDLDVVEPAAEAFLVRDLGAEIYTLIQHLRTHWPALSSSQRRQAVRDLTLLPYPKYLDKVTAPNRRQRLLLHGLRHRRPLLLWVALSLAARLS
jgi:glycosyltransferase involved in cell wall biosynthesis